MGKRKLITLIPAAILVVLLLSSCNFAFPLPEKLPAPSLTHYGSAAERTFFDSEDNSGDDPSKWIKGNPYDWAMLPASIPSMSPEDMASFDPDKAADYLTAASLVHHRYEITDAFLKGETLYVNITDHRSLDNVNDGYQYLKKKFGLTDNQILDIPLFSDCDIEEGYMYWSDFAYDDMQVSGSLKDWLALGTNINAMDLDEPVLSPIPVSDTLHASVIGDEGDYVNMNYSEFKSYVLGGRTSSDFDEDMIGLYYILIDFKGGEITAMFQSTGEE